MFWAFKLSFVVDILANLATFWLFFKKFGNFFSNLLVALLFGNSHLFHSANERDL
jgi:hypothetical protein